MSYFSILQAGTSLQLMDVNGVLTTLTLPTGVTLDASKTPRFTVFGRYVIMVNSPTRPITIDAEGIVRVLVPRPPRTIITLTSTAGGSLSGTFLVKQSFLILDVDGNIISESALGPLSPGITISAKFLTVSGLDLSPDDVSAIRLYRTTSNGTVYFPWFDVDGNTQTTALDDLPDAGLQLAAAPDGLGSAPDLTMIKEFRERLWGRSRTAIDILRYTEARTMYAWSPGNEIVVPREGSDDRGITGIIARREGLAVARQDVLYQVTGENSTNFRLVKMKETIGVIATDSIVVYRDAVYFLARDGVYVWDDDGVKSLSDHKTRTWFTSDTYFNRARFQYAVGRIDPVKNKYQLLLSAVGSDVADRWIELDLDDNTWWGPHKTGAFTPSFVSTLLDANGLAMPVFGSTSGFVWKEQETRTDNIQTGIAFDVDGKFHDGGTPDIEKYFDTLSLISKIQSTGGTLVITPKIAGFTGAADTAINANMALSRQRLRRIGGPARFAQFNFYHDTPAQDVEIVGYELPFLELGRR